MSLEADVKKPVVDPLIKLFKIDATGIGGSVYRYTDMTNGLAVVSWNGEDYQPFPIAITGLDQSSTGAPARPLLALSNVDKFWTVQTALLGDMKGAEVVYIETTGKYLGTAISGAPFELRINKKVSHTKPGISFELKSWLDSDRQFLPGRQMLRQGPEGQAFPGLGLNKSFR